MSIHRTHICIGTTAAEVVEASWERVEASRCLLRDARPWPDFGEIGKASIGWRAEIQSTVLEHSGANSPPTRPDLYYDADQADSLPCLACLSRSNDNS